ncbi:hypothetical protein KI387_022284, partial [Taxus chinensis]
WKNYVLSSLLFLARKILKLSLRSRSPQSTLQHSRETLKRANTPKRARILQDELRHNTLKGAETLRSEMGYSEASWDTPKCAETATP